MKKINNNLARYFAYAFKIEKRILIRIFCIYPVKSILNYKIYCHVLMPVIGVFQLTRKSFYTNIFTLPLAVLGGFSLIHSFVLQEYYSVIRSIQLIGMFGFFGYCLENLSKEDFLSISKKIILLSIFYIPIELLFSEKIGYRWVDIGITNIRFVKIDGLLGNSSYSGALFLGLMLIFMHSKKVLYFFVSILLIYLTASRGAILTVILTPIFYYISKFKTINTIVLNLSLILIMASPFSTVILKNLLNNEHMKCLDYLSTGRFYLQKIYLDKFDKNKFGFGYRNKARKDITNENISHFRSKNTDYSNEILCNGKKVDFLKYTKYWNSKELEEHNILLEVLLGLGIPGYVFLSVFFAVILYYTSSYYLILALIPFVFINGLHEFILYFSFAYAIKFTGNRCIDRA